MSRREHAVVIGGSMAGLVAAHALADHFESVTVLDRDRFAESPEPRKGVPQGKHPHVLLMRGGEILEEMFPGLQDELAASGAPTMDWLADFAWHSAAGWGPRMHSGHIVHPCSRPFLEWHVQRRLAGNPRVQFCSEYDVTGLLPAENGRDVAGVRVRRRGQAAVGGGPAEQALAADLVVDASGRTSRAPDWLAELGYARPDETELNSFLGYATRRFRPPTGREYDWKIMLIYPEPPGLKRGGLIMTVENGDWIATLSGAGKDYPPTDEAGYMAYAASLATPAFYEAVKDAEPLTPVVGYQRTENRWRHYERLERRPEHFVLIGDAVSAFNPVYGQGITAAALGARLLDECLRDLPRGSHDDLAGLASTFHRKLGKISATIWTMATAEDYRYPTTVGPKPPAAMRFAHRYIDQVFLLANKDPRYLLLLIEVLHLVKPGTELYRPNVALRVLPGLLRSAWTPA